MSKSLYRAQKVLRIFPKSEARCLKNQTYGIDRETTYRESRVSNVRWALWVNFLRLEHMEYSISRNMRPKFRVRSSSLNEANSTFQLDKFSSFSLSACLSHHNFRTVNPILMKFGEHAEYETEFNSLNFGLNRAFRSSVEAAFPNSPVLRFFRIVVQTSKMRRLGRSFRC